MIFSPYHTNVQPEANRPGAVIDSAANASPFSAAINFRLLPKATFSEAPRIPGLFFTWTWTSTRSPGSADTCSTAISVRCGSSAYTVQGRIQKSAIRIAVNCGIHIPIFLFPLCFI